MNIEVKYNADHYDITVSGRIDTTNYRQLMTALEPLDLQDKNVLFDFTEVEYISSSGLRTMLVARKKVKDGTMRVVGVSDVVYEIFETTGFSSIIEVERGGSDSSAFLQKSFDQILRERAQDTPDRIFLKDAHTSYTWGEIDDCAQTIAYRMYQKGVRKGAHVGICSMNSANWILTFFAIQKLGAIACLMNFNYSLEEIVTTAEVGDITFLCYGDNTAYQADTAHFVEKLKERSGIRDTLDISSGIGFRDKDTKSDGPKGAIQERVETDDVCVMIYTSGSTGVPKGVLLSAYNILNASVFVAKAIHMEESDRLCLIVPLFHIFGMEAGFFCNVITNSMVIIPENMRTTTLIRTMEEEACTLFHSVPTMALAIMNNKEFHSERVASLRCMILAGAPVTEAQIRNIHRQFCNTHLVSVYGLSEAAPVSVTGYEDTMEHMCRSVGKIVDDLQVMIQDTQTKEECAPGQSGEILVAGFNAMAGYYKAKLDMQAVDDLDWIHTGDLGYLDEEGYLYLTGRAKELIIRGGENIMPNEIAGAISEHPLVADVKVVGVPDDFFGEVVCACVIMKDGQSLDEQKMRDFLAEKLARYKIPAFFLPYTEFPILANAKVDMVSLKKDAVRKTAGSGKG